MPRFLCLWLPDFAAWAAAYADPSLREQPVLAYRAGRIVAISSEARAAGAQVGWTLHRAQAQLPSAVFWPIHGPTINAVWAEVVAALLDFTLYIESQRPGLLRADVRPPCAVLPLLRQWQAQSGVADDRATAELAALTTTRGTLRSVHTGQSAAFLRHVPLTALQEAGVRDDTLERLRWFGWRSVGDLCYLKERQLAAEFDQGRLLFSYAQASDLRPISLYRQPPVSATTFAFDTPVREPREWEPVLALLIEQNLAALQGRGAETVTVIIETANAVQRAHRLLHSLTADKRSFQETARRLLLSLLQNHAPMRRLTLQLGELRVLPAVQGSLFGTKRPPVSVALRAVEERFPGQLQRIVMLDRHAYLPERAFRLDPISPDEELAQPKRDRLKRTPAKNRRAKAPQPKAPTLLLLP